MSKLKTVPAFTLLLAMSLPALAQNDSYDRYGHALVQDSEGWLYIDRDNRGAVR